MKHPARLESCLILLTVTFVGCGTGAPRSAPPVTEAPAETRTLVGEVSALSPDRSSVTIGTEAFLLPSGAVVSVNGATASHAALSVGQHASVTTSGRNAVSIDVRLELRGLIQAVTPLHDTTLLTIAGQRVLITRDTRIDDHDDDDTASDAKGSIAALQVGVYAEVTGQRATDGSIHASKIEVKDDDERREDGLDDRNELSGTVHNLDVAQRTFRIDGQVIGYAGARLDGAIGNGATVEVRGHLNASGVLVAERVKVKDDHRVRPAPGAAIELDDEIEHVDAQAFTFDFEHYTVNYRNAVMNGAPAVNFKARVTGTLDPVNARLVHATSVTLTPDDD